MVDRMHSPFSVLYVDDEEKSLKYFQEVFGGAFPIHTASNAQEGFEILESHKDRIGILMTDQRMPGEKGTELLERVRQVRPRILRFLVTAHTDLEAVIEAVNRGAIYKYITKPWDIPELEITLKRGLEFFGLQRERDQLLRFKSDRLAQRITTDRLLSLGRLTTGISQYLREPLAEIKSFLDVAPNKIQDEHFCKWVSGRPDAWVKVYPTIQLKADRLLRILSRLDEVSHLASEEAFRRMDLRSMVSQAIHRMEFRLKQRKIKVENCIPDCLPFINVQEAGFYRLLELLLEDELAILPEAGTIKFKAKILPKLSHQGSQLQMEIEDNGPQISGGSCNRIFEPFYRRSRDPKVLGLNLMICFWIVHTHGGSMAATNNKREGMTLTLTIPTDSDPSNVYQTGQESFHDLVWGDPEWNKLV